MRVGKAVMEAAQANWNRLVKANSNPLRKKYQDRSKYDGKGRLKDQNASMEVED